MSWRLAAGIVFAIAFVIVPILAGNLLRARRRAADDELEAWWRGYCARRDEEVRKDGV